MCQACSTEQSGGLTGAGKILPQVTVSPEVDAVWGVVSDAVESVPQVDDLTMRIYTDDGAFSAIWTPLSTYYPAESLLPGAYTVEAFYGTERREGFDAPYFYGSASCVLKDGAVEEPVVECTLANTMVSVVFDDGMDADFSECALIFHSTGGSFITYPMDESRQAYLRPGDIAVALDVTMASGGQAMVHMTTIPSAQPGHWYLARVSRSRSTRGYPVVTVSFDERVTSDDVSVELSPEFLAAPAPQILCSGFESGNPVSIAEGQSPDAPLTMSVDTQNLSRLILSSTAPSLIDKGWLPEVDLLSAADITAMKALGLEVSRVGYVMTLDFTRLVPQLRDTDGLADAFSLQAESRTGKLSAPAQLLVDLKNVDVNVVSITMPVVGVNRAAVKVECTPGTDPAGISLEIFDGTAWVAAQLNSIEPDEAENTYNITFTVPAATDSSPARLLYCGMVRESFDLYRVSPEFEIAVDAFAQKAVIRILPADPALLEVITGLAQIYADDARTLQMDRDESAGEITVTGLKERTTYRFRASVMSQPKEGEFTPVVTVSTESAAELPNGNFEKVNSKYTEYKRMPSGGRYSQNIVEIYNLQNYTDFYFTTPERWATVNAKTFNTRAGNVNTWYVIPAVRTVDVDEAYAGTSYAVRIDNVAWDPDGERIPDYLQEGQPYVKYSRNVPAISYKAVGKLFIGSYKFDPATLGETMTEGMSFASRPSALNGFYKYIPVEPGSTETGYACVEVIAEDGSTIAKGEALLPPATGYTAFTVPLVYKYFGVKASRIKVMLAASPKIGGIDYETTNTAILANPPSSTATGSSMWVDELSFSY